MKFLCLQQTCRNLPNMWSGGWLKISCFAASLHLRSLRRVFLQLSLMCPAPARPDLSRPGNLPVSNILVLPEKTFLSHVSYYQKFCSDPCKFRVTGRLAPTTLMKILLHQKTSLAVPNLGVAGRLSHDLISNFVVSLEDFPPTCPTCP
jgi:hypothetical protein